MYNWKLSDAQYRALLNLEAGQILYYCAKWGSDSNPGTRDLPKASPIFTSCATIIAPGYYLAPAVSIGNATQATKVYGDGIVFLNFEGRTFNDNTQSFNAARLQNVLVLNCSLSWAQSRAGQAIDSIFLDSTGRNLGARATTRGCIFINFTNTFSSQHLTQLNKCVLVNCKGFSIANEFYNTYADRESWAYWAGSGASAFRASNIRGKVRSNSVDYELKRRRNGSLPTLNDPATPDFVQVLPEVYSRRSFAQEPNFKNAPLLDFTLKSSSPNFQVSGADVGAFGYGCGMTSREIIESPACLFTSTGIDTSNPDALKVAAGYTEGEISFVIRVSDDPQDIGMVYPYDLINQSVAGLPSYHDVAATYQMRYSTSANQPTTEGEWSAYFEQEWWKVPKINAGVRGYGSQAYDSSQADTIIKAKWLQFKIRLTGVQVFKGIAIEVTSINTFLRVVDGRGRGLAGATIKADNPTSGTPKTFTTDSEGVTPALLDESTPLFLQKDKIFKNVTFTRQNIQTDESLEIESFYEFTLQPPLP